jgi:signal transduction histidine kinase
MGVLIKTLKKTFFVLLLTLVLCFSHAQDVGFSYAEQPIIQWAIFPEIPPEVFLDERGNPTGHHVEIYKRIFNEMGVRYEFVIDRNFSNLYPKILSGEYFITGLLRSRDREDFFYWPTYPIAFNYSALFINRNSSFDTIFDLSNKKIGILRYAAQVVTFQDLLESFGVTPEMVHLNSYEEGQRLVLNGDIYGIVAFSNLMVKEGIVETSLAFSPLSSYATTGKNADQFLLDIIEKASIRLNELKRDEKSYYYEIVERFRKTEVIEKSVVPLGVSVAVYTFLSSSLFFIFLIFILNRRLRKSIKEIIKLNESLATKAKEMSEELAKREKQTSLSRLVGALSHEMNTPLGVMLTSSTFLKSQSEDVLKSYNEEKLTASRLKKFLESLSSSLNIIIMNIERTSDLIKSFKEVSTDKLSEKRRTIDLHDFYQTIFDEVRMKYPQKKIELHLDFEKIIAIDIIPIFQYQVFTNLIVNSFEHGFEYLTEGNIYIKISITDEVIFFEYIDDGEKIPEEIIDKVFEPFFTTKRGKRGHSGLGLNIIYNILTDIYDAKNISVKNLEKGKEFSFEISKNNFNLTKKNNLIIIKEKEVGEINKEELKGIINEIRQHLS